MTVGGFPEPFLDGDERSARRWRRQRLDRILREDIRDLESIRNIQTMGLFLDLLRQRVGGLITLSNLAGDVEVSPGTAKKWLQILERMYLVFAVRPYTRSLPRAILKPPKVYFFDRGWMKGFDKWRLYVYFYTQKEVYMRTNIVIDDKLMEEAMMLSGAKTKKELISNALKEFVTTRKRLNLMDLDGKIQFEKTYNYKALRKEQ